MRRKSMYEIYAAIKILQEAVDSPCDCKGTPHEPSCEGGRVALLAAIAALEWTMGRPSHFGETLARLHEMQAEAALQRIGALPIRREG